MERHTVRQVNRALAQERLLQRLDQGEEFEELCRELGLSLKPSSLPYLRRRYRQGGSTWEALIDHRRGHSYKVTLERRAWLREQKEGNLALTQQELAQRFQEEFQVRDRWSDADGEAGSCLRDRRTVRAPSPGP